MPQFAQVAVNPRAAIRAAARLMRRTNQHPQLTISLRVYRHRPPCPGIDATPRHVEHLTEVCDGHGGLLRLDERESYSLSLAKTAAALFGTSRATRNRRFSLRSRRSSSRSSVVNPERPAAGSHIRAESASWRLEPARVPGSWASPAPRRDPACRHGVYGPHPEATETTTPGGCVLARIGDQSARPKQREWGRRPRCFR